MNKKSLKVQKAEAFVDEHIKEHGFPPTYMEIKQYMNFKSNAQAYGICDKFREKMKKQKLTTEIKFGEWQACPICYGSGKIPTNGITTSIHESCPTCLGTRIIQRPIL